MSMTKFALLTGAGYSKNWGGWLSSELWAVILSHPIVCQNQDLKNIIWQYRERGFEEAFDNQRIRASYVSEYQKIVKDSFVRIHKAISSESAFFNRGWNDKLLCKFDVIFTLNQDLFFEALYPKTDDRVAKYFYPHVQSLSYSQYARTRDLLHCQSINFDSLMLDATLTIGQNSYYQTRNIQAKFPTSFAAVFTPSPKPIKPIPYYKLHGSLNFRDGDNDVLIMGGSKPEQIEKIPLLKKYHEDFGEILKTTEKLMVIGYSFTDYHINHKIFEAVENHNLKFWITDVAPLTKLIINAASQEMQRDRVKELLKPRPGMIANEEYNKKEIFEKVLLPEYEDKFKKGLISISNNSLIEVFKSSWEIDRINERFFN